MAAQAQAAGGGEAGSCPKGTAACTRQARQQRGVLTKAAAATRARTGHAVNRCHCLDQLYAAAAALVAPTTYQSRCPLPSPLSRVPHCCYYIGAFQDSKQIYIVMEHCSGGDLLEQLLKEGRAMTEKRVVREVGGRGAWGLERGCVHQMLVRSSPVDAAVANPKPPRLPSGCLAPRPHPSSTSSTSPAAEPRPLWSLRPQVVVPILTSLAHLHAAGIIHRDIKLENLFVSPTRGIMLGDFGLALCVHEEKPISPVGTLGGCLGRGARPGGGVQGVAGGGPPRMPCAASVPGGVQVAAGRSSSLNPVRSHYHS